MWPPCSECTRGETIFFNLRSKTLNNRVQRKKSTIQFSEKSWI
ncbi:hypothetical protein LEP1GSC021_1949 [Leptospira noguchii str. 1993005606]|nr:hypothetical protein LEP1GSC021_1949 [Leptospira noguchii str. 1993005606]